MPTTEGWSPYAPWWIGVDDAACAWGIAPWSIVERQMSHGDALDWVARHNRLTRARRDAGEG